MADGLTSLATLNWGTSTGGAAGLAETTTTLGVDRVDVRVPPDTSHVWGASLNAVKNLTLTMSQFYLGGTRLKVLSQSSNPFSAGEAGYWTDGTNPKFTNTSGTITTLGTGGSVTSITIGTGLSSTQSPLTTTGTMSVDQTFAAAWTGAHTWTQAVGIAQTPSATLQNTTAATSGSANQKWSPGLQLSGQQYNGSASVQVDYLAQVRPNSGNTTAGDLVFWDRYNAGSWAEEISIRHGGFIWGTTSASGATALSSHLRLDDTTGTKLYYGAQAIGINDSVFGINIQIASADVVTIAASQVRRIAYGERLSHSAANKTGAYTIVLGDYYVPTDTTGGAFTITLPAPATAGSGATYVLVDVTNKWATNNLTLARSASESIDGTAANKVLSTAGDRRIVWTDGTNWYTK